MSNIKIPNNEELLRTINFKQDVPPSLLKSRPHFVYRIKNSLQVQLSISGTQYTLAALPLGYEPEAARLADAATYYFREYRRSSYYNFSESQARHDVSNEPEIISWLSRIFAHLRNENLLTIKRAPGKPLIEVLATTPAPSSEFSRIEQSIKDILCRIDEQHKEISALRDQRDSITARLHAIEQKTNLITITPTPTPTGAIGTVSMEPTPLWPFNVYADKEKPQN